MYSRKEPQRDAGWWNHVIRRLRLGRHLSDSDVASLTYGNELVGTSHNAVDASTLALARAHMDTCEVCRQRVLDARAQDHASAMLLSALDGATPNFDAAAILARAKDRPTDTPKIGHAVRPRPVPVPVPVLVPVPVPVPVPLPVHRSRQYAIAASFLFAMIGVTALAFPGSPLRTMLERVGQTHATRDPRSVRDTARMSLSAAEAMSSVATVPASHFMFEFRGRASAVPTLTVRYCDTALASLRVVHANVSRPIGAASRKAGNSARFAVSADRIVVTPNIANDSVPVMYELAVPDSTRLLSVRANDRVVNVHRLNSGQQRGTDRCDPPIAIAWTP